MAEYLTMTADQGYEVLSSTAEINGNSFDLLRLISTLADTPGRELTARDLLIRTLEKRESIDLNLQSILDSSTASLGLYPYIQNINEAGAVEQIQFEYHRPPSGTSPLTDFVFHSMQKAVFDRLLAGESLFLSAPTSFGKSVIIDALIQSRKWSNIFIIVPTLALIDETRRRVVALNTGYKIITHPSQSPANENVYVLTQERFLELPLDVAVDFFIVDEFYKLDSTAGDSRAIQLNIAWDRLRRTGAQYYLIGPNIDELSPDLPASLRQQLIVTDFRTVASDQYRVENDDMRGALTDLCSQLEGPTLIYVRSPARAREVGEWLLEADVGSASSATTIAADWIGKTFHPDWILGRCLRRGIGLHHGRIPRALQHHILRHFNDGDVKFLVCTSTLIEGVNTAARNVVVFDKTLNQRNLDHFTFNNIRGRAGRMLRHFVGQVYTFAEEPTPTARIVDIPITSQSKRASEAALLQLPPQELSSESQARLADLQSQDLLPMDVLRRNRGIDPTAQVAIAREISQSPVYFQTLLAWVGVPSFDQRVEACRFIMETLGVRPIGRATPRSVATRIDLIRRFEASVPRLVPGQMQFSRSLDDAVEEVIYFIRNYAGFEFPSALMALERIQSAVFATLGMASGSYAYFASQAESYFLPTYFSVLEEYGLPYQLAVKLRPYGLGGGTLDEVLLNLRRLGLSLGLRAELDQYEREMLADVVLGLG